MLFVVNRISSERLQSFVIAGLDCRFAVQY